jgi:hypothetical protein
MPRGQTQRIGSFIQTCFDILQAIQPASVRAVAYQLFIRHWIESMAKTCTNRVSNHLVTARKDGRIPWEWVVDETREPDYPGTWDDAEQYLQAHMRLYRRDRWTTQPHRVEIWSEKNTVRGTLAPVIDQFGVIYRPMHGFTSWTCTHKAAEEWRTDPKPTTILYVGDWDPSGLYMSEVDLPHRLSFENVCGDMDVFMHRVAILGDNARQAGLPSFLAAGKRTDTRYAWWRSQGYGATCWELDAMNPNDLRAVVQAAIEEYLDWDAWLRADEAEAAEQRSMQQFLHEWNERKSG